MTAHTGSSKIQFLILQAVDTYRALSYTDEKRHDMTALVEPSPHRGMMAEPVKQKRKCKYTVPCSITTKKKKEAPSPIPDKTIMQW
jgi:hypothetical protein